MQAIEGIRRSGVPIAPDRTIRQAAVIMEQAGVGALVVVDGKRIVGIVTDRDLVRRAMARDLPPDARIDHVMSTPVITIAADADVQTAITLLKNEGIRRLPVERDGEFAGMLTVDDLLVDIANDLRSLVQPVISEMLWSHRDAPQPAQP